MSATLGGLRSWRGGRSREGHVEFDATWRVFTNNANDGPYTVMNCPGLPAIGSSWSFGNDLHLWAFCLPTMRVTPQVDGEINTEWWVDQKFSTLPLQRCQDTSIENPLLEPAKLSGSFVKFTEEISEDKDGKAILSSSLERIRGAEIEFDNNRPTVSIEMNFASNQLANFAPMVDTVNDATLWGLGPRKVKLSNVSWSRHLYGVCTFYYTVAYEFEVNAKGFDRKVWDRGLREWVDGDVNDPARYTPIVDEWTDTAITTPVNLDGGAASGVPGRGGRRYKGLPANAPKIDVIYYKESNFLTLGIPSSL